MILGRKNRWRFCLSLGAILLGFSLLLLHPSGSSAARHRFSPSRFAGVSAQAHSAPIIGQRQEGGGEAGLDAGQTLTRELAGGQAHSYQIKLRAGEKGDEAYARLVLGWTYADLKEREKAEEQYRAALHQWETSSNKQGQEITKQSLVNLSQRRDEPSAGDRAFAEAETLRKQGTAETYRQAIAKYGEAAALYRAEGNKAREALSLHEAGYLYSALGEKAKALEYYQQALPLRRAVSDRKGEAVTLSDIGGVYFDLGEKAKALEYLQQALPLRRAVKDRRGEALTLNNIGLVYSALGEKQKALEYLQQALSLIRAGRDRRGEAGALGNIEQALSWIRELRDRGGEAATLTGISVVYADLGEKQKALEYLRQALSLSRVLRDRRGEALTLNGIGRVYSALGEKQKALEYYQQALPLLHAVKDRRGEAFTLNNIGRVYFDLGEKQKASECLQQALPLSRVVGDRRGEAATLGNLMVLWKSSDPRLAIFYGKQSVNLLQQLRTDIQGLDRSLQQSFLESVESVYHRLADLLIGQGRLPEAERVYEMLKEEEYFQYSRRDQKVASALKLRADLTEIEARALAEYTRLADRLTALGKELEQLEALRLKLPEDATFPQQARYDELKNQLAAAVKTFAVFQRQLAEEFGKADYRVKEMESGLQASLKNWGISNTALITTLAGEERLHVIVTTPTVQEPHTVEIKAAKLNQLVAEFRAAVTHPCACIDPRPAGQKLYEVLIKPIEGDLKGAQTQTLLWRLDGTLRYVPLGALWDGRQYLAERFTNVVITLASRDKVAIEPQPVQKWRGLGLGVSQAWGDFPALPAVPEELRSIIRQESSGKAGENGVLPGRRLLDTDFTRAALERALGRYAVIHVASHFSFKPEKEKSSYLLLGDGSAYTLEAVTSATPLFSGVELLTLSACNTAMGGESNGREVEGFGELAQKQGALAVVATLWAVSDESTGKLMQEFYRLRTATPGMTKGEALREAQLALLRGQVKKGEGGTADQRTSKAVGTGANASGQPQFKYDPDRPYAHPYYWAPFILIGNWK